MLKVGDKLCYITDSLKAFWKLFAKKIALSNLQEKSYARGRLVADLVLNIVSYNHERPQGVAIGALAHPLDFLTYV